MADELPDHFCPGCAKPQKAFLRYPWYFCQDCVDRAKDHGGQGIGFYERTLHGGLAWYDKADPVRLHKNLISVYCLIDGRPVMISEARFGGIVAEPLNNHVFPPKDDGSKYADLTSKTGTAAARAKMTDGE